MWLHVVKQDLLHWILFIYVGWKVILEDFKISDDELQDILENVKDDTLRLSLQFGMGLHHAGLVESDRQISHKLFEQGKSNIDCYFYFSLGVNLPAHLVIIKGTQF